MIHLALAVVLANPCLAPVHHKHHTVTPVQSCVVPAVPMCFKDPVPDPEIAPIPQVLPYYITPTADDGTQGEGPYIGEADSLVPSSSVMPGVPGLPPMISYPPPPPAYVAPFKTPEISAAGTMPALVLLLGAIAILKGKKS